MASRDGVAYREIEDVAVALMAQHLPVPDFNSVIGLRAGQETEIGPVTWYRERGVAGRFEIFRKPLEPFSRTSRTGLCRTKTEIGKCRPETAAPKPVTGVPEFEELPA
jgi:hypothetical protein